MNACISGFTFTSSNNENAFPVDNLSTREPGNTDFYEYQIQSQQRGSHKHTESRHRWWKYEHARLHRGATLRHKHLLLFAVHTSLRQAQAPHTTFRAIIKAIKHVSMGTHPPAFYTCNIIPPYLSSTSLPPSFLPSFLPVSPSIDVPLPLSSPSPTPSLSPPLYPSIFLPPS